MQSRVQRRFATSQQSQAGELRCDILKRSRVTGRVLKECREFLSRLAWPCQVTSSKWWQADELRRDARRRCEASQGKERIDHALKDLHDLETMVQEYHVKVSSNVCVRLSLSLSLPFSLPLSLSFPLPTPLSLFAFHFK